jgi:hypothetical protein
MRRPIMRIFLVTACLLALASTPSHAQLHQDEYGVWVNEAGGNLFGDSRYNIEADPRYNINADPRFNINADPRFNINADPRYNINADPSYSLYGDPRYDPDKGDLWGK